MKDELLFSGLERQIYSPEVKPTEATEGESDTEPCLGRE
jgi:hypothetical protein